MSEQHQGGDGAAATAKALPLGGAGQLALHALENVQLSSTINDTLDERRVVQRRANSDVVADTQLRTANQNLIAAIFAAMDSRAAAEATNKRQTEFLSVLSHELRNPLHSVILANDLIGKIAGAHPDLPRLHGIIDRQLANLVHLVEDLLDVSRINAGKIEIQTGYISAQEVIENAVEVSLPVLRSRQQYLELNVPAKPIYINGDLIRLTQVFSNLLLNASKYTPESGHLIVRVTPRERDVEFAVIDDGAGVPIDIQPYIFDLFVQGPRPQVPAQSGLGIGLSLVRTIVQLHGGAVSVRSSGNGTGSQFIVTLPLAGLSRQSA